MGFLAAGDAFLVAGVWLLEGSRPVDAAAAGLRSSSSCGEWFSGERCSGAAALGCRAAVCGAALCGAAALCAAALCAEALCGSLAFGLGAPKARVIWRSGALIETR